ncbi:hypothetical protein, partial [Enterobacter hormaechei]|uniref:hypothetical protein n=1 Tax=Enterobacter hormaechei TaxID=158836 RepID=UPI0025778FB0
TGGGPVDRASELVRVEPILIDLKSDLSPNWTNLTQYFKSRLLLHFKPDLAQICCVGFLKSGSFYW